MKILLSAAFLMAAILTAKAGQAGITSGPKDLTINAGSTADFIVTATNARTYQWSFQGAGMAQATNIAGATNFEYKIDNTGTNQAGVYSVIVGSTGTNITNSANLTVIQGTIIQFQISGFAGGATSNVMVELFDHDKPATVQNFVHYVRSGAYSNMFFDRLLPGFVLQGGDWYAQDQTNSTSPPTVGEVYQTYVGITPDRVLNPTLPDQVDNEFFVGPKVSNKQGTIAMTLSAGDADSAASGFFFNLVDNTNLDTTNTGGGPFTVFGRVLSGTNVLQYFNNTNEFFKPAFKGTPSYKIFTHGIFDNIGYEAFNDLPVNYHGTNVPADDNLFFVDFSFPDTNAQPLIDTNPPIATITFPPPNMILTNGIPLTLQGTAQALLGNTALSLDGSVLAVPGTEQDDAGLALVICTVIPANGAYGGSPFEADAVGTANWSFNVNKVMAQQGYLQPSLQPGIYYVLVQPQDGAGNLGNPNFMEQSMTITAVLTNGVGAVTATDLATGADLGDAVGANLVPGTSYSFAKQSGPGWFFVNWQYGTKSSLNPSLTLKMTTNTVLTANFASNTVPGGISFTYPPAGGNTADGTFSIQGTLNGLLTPPVTITCRLFSSTNQQLAGSVSQVKLAKGMQDWSFPVANLALGPYYAEVTAQDAADQGTVITNAFTAGYPLTLLAGGNGQGTMTCSGGLYLAPGRPYSVTAVPDIGSLFETWSSGAHSSASAVYNFTMEPGLVLTANFITPSIPGAIAFTYPPLQGNTPNGTFSIQGTIGGSLAPPVSLKCQLFSYTNQSPAGRVLLTTGKTNWSFPVSNLPLGHYYLQVVATNAAGQITLITNDFSAGYPLAVYTSGNGQGGLRANFTGTFLAEGARYLLEAVAARGSVFETWSDGVNYTNNPVYNFTMKPGLVLIATFLSNDIPGTLAFTYPASGEKLTTQNFNLTGTISNSVTNPFVTYQLFYGSNSLTPPSTNVTVTPGRLKSTWSAGLTNMAPGYYTVVAAVSDALGRSTLISESFQVLAQVLLQVAPDGSGTISSNWTGQFVSVGVPHTLTATTNGGYVFAFWSNSVGGLTANNVLTFAATTNTTFTAWFASNYFPGVAGNYYGLFYPTNPGSVISASNSGFYTLSVKSNAMFSLSLSFPGASLAYSGAFPLYVSDPSGFAHVEHAWKGLDGQPVTNIVHLDMTNGTYSLNGVVTNGKFSSPLNGYRAATSLTAGSAVIPGTNVFVIPGDPNPADNLPAGDGSGSLTVGTNGAVSLIGRLADNTSISQHTYVSTNFNGANGIWPLYASLYSGKGIILGWQTWQPGAAPTNFAGWAAWSKPARASAYVTNAFVFLTNAWSAGYVPPTPGARYQIAFGGASLANGLTNTLTFTNGLFTVDRGQTNNLGLTSSLATGVLDGSFTFPSAKNTHLFYGAFVSPALGGSGYFLDTNSQTGWFVITGIGP
jgi:cyclophilin family peptidyl-prolyl cis-trans isomerase